jgi:hypothetical protein
VQGEACQDNAFQVRVVVAVGACIVETEQGPQGGLGEFQWMEWERIPVTGTTGHGWPVAGPVRLLETQPLPKRPTAIPDLGDRLSARSSAPLPDQRA